MARLLQILLLVLLAFIAWRLLRQWLGGFLAPPGQPPAGNDARFEPTARCARCETHVPRTQLDESNLCPRCRQGPSAPP